MTGHTAPTLAELDAAGLQKLSAVMAIALDVDGVLTDGGIFWGPDGQEWKRFSFTDIMGISLAKKQGIAFTLISGEASPLVDRFAQKMGIADVYKGCKDKASALREWMKGRGLQRGQVCFMGDDVNDISAMAEAGFAAAPANANQAVLKVVNFVTVRRGGDGAVREMLDGLLASKARGL